MKMTRIASSKKKKKKELTRFLKMTNFTSTKCGLSKWNQSAAFFKLSNEERVGRTSCGRIQTDVMYKTISNVVFKKLTPGNLNEPENTEEDLKHISKQAAANRQARPVGRNEVQAGDQAGLNRWRWCTTCLATVTETEQPIFSFFSKKCLPPNTAGTPIDTFQERGSEQEESSWSAGFLWNCCDDHLWIRLDFVTFWTLMIFLYAYSVARPLVHKNIHPCSRWKGPRKHQLQRLLVRVLLTGHKRPLPPSPVVVRIKKY